MLVVGWCGSRVLPKLLFRVRWRDLRRWCAGCCAGCSWQCGGEVKVWQKCCGGWCASCTMVVKVLCRVVCRLLFTVRWRSAGCCAGCCAVELGFLASKLGSGSTRRGDQWDSIAPLSLNVAVGVVVYVVVLTFLWVT